MRTTKPMEWEETSMSTMPLRMPFASKASPKVVASVAGASEAEWLELARKGLSEGADVVEWRADAAEGVGDPASLAERCQTLKQAIGSTPLLFTLRTAGQGGAADVDLAQYAEVLFAVVQAGAADAVDIEADLCQGSFGELAEIAQMQGMAVVASHHEFDAMPSVAQIMGKIDELAGLGADVLKVAYAAQCPSDAQRLMAAVSAYTARHPECAVAGIAMGQDGAFSRLMPQAFGSCLTFATPGAQTAAGQHGVAETARAVDAWSRAVSGHDFEAFARIADELQPRSAVALLGHPVSSSLSPAVHDLSFAHAGADAVYAALDCNEEQIGRAIQAMKSSKGWVGANVTIPCKRAALRSLDDLDDSAAIIRSVNTIAIRDGRAIGYNTDGVGFRDSLFSHDVRIDGKRVCVLGSGGAAHAVVAQLALEGAMLINVMCHEDSPHRQSMASLAASLRRHSTALCILHDIDDEDELAGVLSMSHILVNATPAGSAASEVDTAVPLDLLRPDMAVVDLVYNPAETELVRKARELGCTAFGGTEMLFAQAAAAERIWLDNVEMDIAAVAQELGEVL